MNLALIVFWLSIGVVIYTYIIFPLILVMRGILWPRHHHEGNITPSVSMIIAAYNEAASIEQKLKNVSALKYPADKLEVIIASDGSDDGTNEIVATHSDSTIHLLKLPRLGKADALNAAVEQSNSDILVFSDANSLYATDAIQQLVKHFADPQVGGVAGNQRYIKNKATQDNAGEKSYWRFDRQLKIWESAGGNTISATGAIYAIRRELFDKVPLGVTDDFVTSVRVIEHGYWLVFEPNAIAYESTTKNQQREFGRKVRIITRGFNSVLVMSNLLNPFKYGFYALQLFTHKILRRLLYIPLILIFLSNIPLVLLGWPYQLAFGVQVAFYAAAIFGGVFIRNGVHLPKWLSIPTFVCMVYVAAAIASWNIVRGHKIVRWSTDSRQANEYEAEGNAIT